MMENIEIDKSIKEYLEVNEQIKKLESQKDIIKATIKLKMHEIDVTQYIDDNGNYVDIKTQNRINIDKDKVRELLGEAQFKQVSSITKFDVMRIVSKENREKMKNFARKKNE